MVGGLSRSEFRSLVAGDGPTLHELQEDQDYAMELLEDYFTGVPWRLGVFDVDSQIMLDAQVENAKRTSRIAQIAVGRGTRSPLPQALEMLHHI